VRDFGGNSEFQFCGPAIEKARSAATLVRNALDLGSTRRIDDVRWLWPEASAKQGRWRTTGRCGGEREWFVDVQRV